MAHIEKWINIEENGIYLVFGVTEENQLKFLLPNRLKGLTRANYL